MDRCKMFKLIKHYFCLVASLLQNEAQKVSKKPSGLVVGHSFVVCFGWFVVGLSYVANSTIVCCCQDSYVSSLTTPSDKKTHGLYDRRILCLQWTNLMSALPNTFCLPVVHFCVANKHFVCKELLTI